MEQWQLEKDLGVAMSQFSYLDRIIPSLEKIVY